MPIFDTAESDFSLRRSSLRTIYRRRPHQRQSLTAALFEPPDQPAAERSTGSFSDSTTLQGTAVSLGTAPRISSFRPLGRDDLPYNPTGLPISACLQRNASRMERTTCSALPSGNRQVRLSATLYGRYTGRWIFRPVAVRQPWIGLRAGTTPCSTSACCRGWRWSYKAGCGGTFRDASVRHATPETHCNVLSARIEWRIDGLQPLDCCGRASPIHQDQAAAGRPQSFPAY